MAGSLAREPLAANDGYFVVLALKAKEHGEILRALLC
jgi:hypothetical protein